MGKVAIRIFLYGLFFYGVGVITQTTWLLTPMLMCYYGSTVCGIMWLVSIDRRPDYITAYDYNQWLINSGWEKSNG